MVIREILRDLRKEWSRVLFYAVVAAMTAIATLYLSVSFSTVKRQSRSIRSFIRQDVVMFQKRSLPLTPNEETVRPEDSHEEDVGDLTNALQDLLSQSGNAGSFVFVSDEGKMDFPNDQILILFGRYGALMGFDTENEMAIFLPKG